MKAVIGKQNYGKHSELFFKKQKLVFFEMGHGFRVLAKNCTIISLVVRQNAGIIVNIILSIAISKNGCCNNFKEGFNVY